MIMLRMGLATSAIFVRTSRTPRRLFDLALFNQQNGSNCQNWAELITVACQIIGRPFWKPVFIHNRVFKNLNRRRSYKVTGNELKLTGQPGLLYTVTPTYLITPKTNILRFRLDRCDWNANLELGCWENSHPSTVGRHLIETSCNIYSDYKRPTIVINPYKDSKTVVDKFPDGVLNPCCSKCHMLCCERKNEGFFVGIDQVYQLLANFATGRIELSINDIFVCSMPCDLTKQLYFFATIRGGWIVTAL